MDYDDSFDSPRSPVFVEGGGASPTGWPLHRMTLQPWRIYDPSFRYHHSVYEELNAHVLARDDGRDQRPGRGPPARPAGCFALIMREMTHLRRQSQFPSLCFSSFFQLHLPFPLTGGYECRFSAPRPFRREPDSARLSPFALSSECSYFTPFFLASAPRSRSGRWGFYPGCE